ncbi:hypothetical protein GCM10028818_18660 [Spirosoma horti]
MNLVRGSEGMGTGANSAKKSTAILVNIRDLIGGVNAQIKRRKRRWTNTPMPGAFGSNDFGETGKDYR